MWLNILCVLIVLKENKYCFPLVCSSSQINFYFTYIFFSLTTTKSVNIAHIQIYRRRIYTQIYFYFSFAFSFVLWFSLFSSPVFSQLYHSIWMTIKREKTIIYVKICWFFFVSKSIGYFLRFEYFLTFIVLILFVYLSFYFKQVKKYPCNCALFYGNSIWGREENKQIYNRRLINGSMNLSNMTSWNLL